MSNSTSECLAEMLDALHLAQSRLADWSRAPCDVAFQSRLLDSFQKIEGLAALAELRRVCALAQSGAAIIRVGASGPLVLPALRRCVSRMRKIARDAVRLHGGSDRGLLDILRTLAGALPTQRFAAPLGVVPNPTHLQAVEAEMLAASAMALDAAQRLPDNGLAVAVKRLAAIRADNENLPDLALIDGVWRGAPILSQRLSRDLGKHIRLEIRGEALLIERRLIPVLSECVMHAVRFCAEQGLESARSRLAAGKPAEGLIALTVACDAAGLSITLADDGAGVCEAAADGEPAKAVAAVRRRIEGLGGALHIIAAPGWGVSLTMALPAGALGVWRIAEPAAPALAVNL